MCEFFTGPLDITSQVIDLLRPLSSMRLLDGDYSEAPVWAHYKFQAQNKGEVDFAVRAAAAQVARAEVAKLTGVDDEIADVAEYADEDFAVHYDDHWPTESFELIEDYDPDEDGAEEPPAPAPLRISEARDILFEIVLCQIEAMAEREEFDEKHGDLDYYNLLAEEERDRDLGRLEEDRIWD